VDLRRGAFKSEPPTGQIPRTQAQRAAKLAADWRDCAAIPGYQATIERIAANLARLARGRDKARG